MPCYTQTSIEIEGSTMNPERLKKVIEKLGLPADIAYLRNGNFIVQGSSQEQTEYNKKKIMQEYSAQVIREASKRFGWTIKAETKTKTGLSQINLIRR